MILFDEQNPVSIDFLAMNLEFWIHDMRMNLNYRFFDTVNALRWKVTDHKTNLRFYVNDLVERSTSLHWIIHETCAKICKRLEDLIEKIVKLWNELMECISETFERVKAQKGEDQSNQRESVTNRTKKNQNVADICRKARVKADETSEKPRMESDGGEAADVGEIDDERSTGNGGVVEDKVETSFGNTVAMKCVTTQTESYVLQDGIVDKLVKGQLTELPAMNNSHMDMFGSVSKENVDGGVHDGKMVADVVAENRPEGGVVKELINSGATEMDMKCEKEVKSMANTVGDKNMNIIRKDQEVEDEKVDVESGKNLADEDTDVEKEDKNGYTKELAKENAEVKKEEKNNKTDNIQVIEKTNADEDVKLADGSKSVESVELVKETDSFLDGGQSEVIVVRAKTENGDKCQYCGKEIHAKEKSTDEMPRKYETLATGDSNEVLITNQGNSSTKKTRAEKEIGQERSSAQSIMEKDINNTESDATCTASEIHDLDAYSTLREFKGKCLQIVDVLKEMLVNFLTLFDKKIKDKLTFVRKVEGRNTKMCFVDVEKELTLGILDMEKDVRLKFIEFKRNLVDLSLFEKFGLST